MKTFEQHLQEEHRTIDSLYSILNTLTNEEIEESVKSYAKVYAISVAEDLISTAYQANNHARQLLNKFDKDNSREMKRVDDRAKFLADNFGNNNEPKIVQS